MSAADRIAAAANERVAAWPQVDRDELAARLAEKPIVRELASGGFLVDVGEGFPFWRRDENAVDRLLINRARLAAEVRASA